MRRLARAVATMFLVAWAALHSAAHPATAQPDPDEFDEQLPFDESASAGFFVGVRNFVKPDGSPSEDILPVTYAVDDAVDLAYLFSLQLGLIRPADVVLALAGEPEKRVSVQRLNELNLAGARQVPAGHAELTEELDLARRRAGERGFLLVSLSTHGYEMGGRAFVLARDSDLAELEATSLELDHVTDQVALAEAQRRMVLVDACRERVEKGRRAVGRETGLSSSLSQALAGVRGTVVLMAATAGGFSYEDQIAQNGVFTLNLIKGLTGSAATDEDGFITPRTLSDYVHAGVIEYVKKRRRKDRKVSKGITAVFEGAAPGMPLARKEGARAVRVSTSTKTFATTAPLGPVPEHAWTAFDEGKALLKKRPIDWEKVAEHMTTAISIHPLEVTGVKRDSRGLRSHYLPFYYLGFVHYKQGGCAAWSWAWERSLAQGAVDDTVEGRMLERFEKECQP